MQRSSGVQVGLAIGGEQTQKENGKWSMAWIEGNEIERTRYQLQLPLLCLLLKELLEPLLLLSFFLLLPLLQQLCLLPQLNKEEEEKKRRKVLRNRRNHKPKARS